MNGSKNYKDLEIYSLSYKLAMDIHKISLLLPKYELYEEGSQIRRASKSIPVNIVEGYGRRYYKYEFIKFLIYALASCDETQVHLDFIFDSEYIKKEQYDYFKEEYDKLGRKINKFIDSVEERHNITSIENRVTSNDRASQNSLF